MTRPGDIPGAAVGVVVTGATLTILVIVGTQITSWLKTGIWPEYSIFQALYDVGVQIPPISWLGLQKIVYFLLDFHVGFLVLVLAWPLVYVAYWFGQAIERIFAPPYRPAGTSPRAR